MLENLSHISDRFWFVFAFAIGLIFGSFANVVICRLPQKKSIIKPPSTCPACQRLLAVIDLIPIFSWVFLKGKCRSCKAKISVRYSIVELTCGLLFASMVYYSPTLSAIPLSILAFVMLVVSFIDWDTQEIYDNLLIVGTISGVTWVALGHFFPESFPYVPIWHNALLGAAAGTIPLLTLDRVSLFVWKKDGFGYGDIKLMAMIGIFIGWQLTLLAFFFAVLSSFPLAVYYTIKQRLADNNNFNGYFAFGPFLCIGAILAFWFGELIFNIYGV